MIRRLPNWSRLCDEVGVARVVGHLFVPEVGLGDEKVTVGCSVDQGIGPCGVAAVGDTLAGDTGPQPKRWATRHVVVDLDRPQDHRARSLWAECRVGVR